MEEGIKKVAIKMIKADIDNEIIAQFTDLSIAQIELLRELETIMFE